MYYLSFDCATKTFAYSLSYIDLSNDNIINQYNLFISEPNQLIENFIKFKSSIINIIDVEMIDFFPNVSDSKINTVDRITKISNYIKTILFEKIKDISIDNINIVIEFQMGSNHKARMVSSALIAIFSEYKVILINPSLKNKVYVNENGKHKHFIKKYSNLYLANKEHTKYNFSIIMNIFPSNIKNIKKNDIGHIADSFMQVLGYILFEK